MSVTSVELPAVEYAERTDPGRDPEKQVNEDACGHRETRFGHLCVVCDGMGGHAAGREAAELALATIFEVFDAAPPGSPPGQVLRGSLEEASRRVHTMKTDEIAGGRPGSTAVAVLMHPGGTEVAHIGDSRAYLVHGAQIVRVTRDHSIVQELVDRGLMTLQQAAHHPDANRITRALGMAPEVEAELRPQPVPHVPGDTFVLCSDGLSDLVEDAEILSIVGGAPAAQATGKLVDLANARGGHDNITVIVLRAREAAHPVAGAVAPTVAQTALTEAPATVPHAPPGGVEERGADRKTQPLLPAAVPPPVTIPEPPARPSLEAIQPRRANPFVVAAVLLAIAAVGLLGAVLWEHLGERSGRERRHTGNLRLLMEEDVRAPAASLAPGSAEVPEASAPAEPIAPLSPSPSGKGR